MLKAIAVVIAATSVVLLAGCAGIVDESSLVGSFADETTGASIALREDGVFQASAVPAEVLDASTASGALSFTGTWEYLEDADFIYLSVDETVTSTAIGGVQLYVSGSDRLYFQPDPDGAPLVEFVRE